jgi:hypothetical protein
MLSDLFIECVNQFSSVFVVLDAFDESLENERSELINEIARYSQSGLRQLMTTRPHPLDEKVKNTLKVTDDDIVEIEAKKEDVEKYLAKELDEKAEDIIPELRTAIIEKITLAVQGKYDLFRIVDLRFLLAEFQLKYILDKRNEPLEMLACLSSLPLSLEDAYKDIIDRIGKRGSGTKDLASRILTWVFHAGRRLKMDELCELLSVKKGDRALSDKKWHPKANRIVDVCESLVVHDSNGTVRFTHYTVNEFLRDEGRHSVLHVFYSRDLSYVFVVR